MGYVNGWRYSNMELKAIETARDLFPSVSQRQLARLLFTEDYHGLMGTSRRRFENAVSVLSGRSYAAVYGAIRRYDKSRRNEFTPVAA